VATQIAQHHFTFGLPLVLLIVLLAINIVFHYGEKSALIELENSYLFDPETNEEYPNRWGSNLRSALLAMATLIPAAALGFSPSWSLLLGSYIGYKIIFPISVVLHELGHYHSIREEDT